MSSKVEAITNQLIENNRDYAAGRGVHRSQHPGKQPIRPARRVAVVACMDARLAVEDLLGLETGEAHIIRNAGGVVAEDTIRSLVISHHLLDTREIALVHHTRCGMLAFTDDLLKAGLEGDPDVRSRPGQRPRLRLRRRQRSPVRGGLSRSQGLDRLDAT